MSDRRAGIKGLGLPCQTDSTGSSGTAGDWKACRRFRLPRPNPWHWLVTADLSVISRSMPKIKSSKDILMLLLYVPGTTRNLFEPIAGQTRLMKMVFLFKKELANKLDKIVDASALPSFEAYDFGPFSSEVYADLEFLVNNGLVGVKNDEEGEEGEAERKELEYWHATLSATDEEPDGYVGRTFSLTALGQEFVKEVLLAEINLTTAQQSVLAEFKKRCVEASLRSLLKYVYSRYESMTTKSKIKEDILQ